jgi:hypothetical protein
MQEIRSHDPQAEPDAHNCETYCQRSDHGGSLAKQQIEDENQTEDMASTVKVAVALVARRDTRN